jgi:hypothetical protein
VSVRIPGLPGNPGSRVHSAGVFRRTVITDFSIGKFAERERNSFLDYSGDFRKSDAEKTNFR